MVFFDENMILGGGIQMNSLLYPMITIDTGAGTLGENMVTYMFYEQPYYQVDLLTRDIKNNRVFGLGQMRHKRIVT